MARYVVGIDLGTTNSALAFVELATSNRTSAAIESFRIPQHVDLGEIGSSALLPSCLYLPADPERQLTAPLPWNDSVDLVVGEGARKQGSRVPARLISSAKSWLCHGGVDRQADILPWHGDEEVPKMSPVEASRRILAHLRSAWDHAHPGDPLAEQAIVLTVPASFDEAARELTMEAARRAGLEALTLLEEPQAAFYQWLHDPSRANDPPLPVGTACVVIDCGGGTTDFSLIGVVERGGTSAFERLAVGDHLLLGGDNIDVALARHVEQHLADQRQVDPRRLDAAQWNALVLECRRIKEIMLSSNPPEKESITLLGRGRGVIGASRTIHVDRQTVWRIALEGFFPSVGLGEEPLKTAGAGLREFGLPFVRDPAITRHLASFLSRHLEQIRETTGSAAPTAVLFNGGVFNAEAARRQVLFVLRQWFGATFDPRVLETSSLDLAVARGAAAFGWARATRRTLVRGGAARSYYVGIDAGEKGHEQTLLCLVPHGLREEEPVRVTNVPLELRLGEPAVFPLFTSTVRTKDNVGELIKATSGQLLELPALTTVLRGGRRAGAKTVRIELEARLTSIGTVELSAVTLDGQQRWKLQFSTRVLPAERAGRESNGTVEETWTEEQLDAARAVLREGLESSDPGRLAAMTKKMESALGLSRQRWSLPALRGLWPTLLDLEKERRRSPLHEGRWQNLAGFLLRPGWGDALDSYRVEQLWKLAHQGVIAVKNDQVWSEYWIMNRRAAGGLDAGRQKELANRALGYVQSGPGGKKAPRRASPHEMSEIWRVLASLELLSSGLKTSLGQSLIGQMNRRPLGRHVFWSIARLGARVPLYGPANAVISPRVADDWIRALLLFSCADRQEEAERDFALVSLARATGDRALDVDDETRANVISALEQRNAPARWITMVRQPTQLDSEEEGRLLGDALPPGLRLATQSD